MKFDEWIREYTRNNGAKPTHVVVNGELHEIVRGIDGGVDRLIPVLSNKTRNKSDRKRNRHHRWG